MDGAGFDRLAPHGQIRRPRHQTDNYQPVLQAISRPKAIRLCLAIG